MRVWVAKGAADTRRRRGRPRLGPMRSAFLRCRRSEWCFAAARQAGLALFQKADCAPESGCFKSGTAELPSSLHGAAEGG